jgi:rod shape-determining protein MreC
MKENIRLKRLLDLKELEGRRPVVARVIGVERKYVMKTIMINRGTADGVYLGAPVVTDRGWWKDRRNIVAHGTGPPRHRRDE